MDRYAIRSHPLVQLRRWALRVTHSLPVGKVLHLSECAERNVRRNGAPARQQRLQRSADVTQGEWFMRFLRLHHLCRNRGHEICDRSAIYHGTTVRAEHGLVADKVCNTSLKDFP